jgi:hypothetical protein
MKIKNLITFGACAIAFAAFTIVACKKTADNTATATTEQSGMTADHAQLENANNDVIATADAAAAPGGAANLRVTSCATVTRSFNGTDSVLTIDFGTGCTGIDGRSRSGQIIVTYSGQYKDSGSTHTISYNNFYLDGYRIGGTKTVTNMGTAVGGSIAGAVWYQVTVNDSLYVTADSVATMVGNRTRTWKNGYATPTRTDDSYEIGGITTITRANGKQYTFTISSTNPLVVAFGCRWIEEGIVTITSTTLANTWTINYGNGACNPWATLTIAGKSYTIRLR